MSGTSARLLTLLSLLQSPRERPGSELAERLGVTTRTIRRDVERLRDLGYPVEAGMGGTGGYRLVAGSAMPPLLLDDEEAVAIAVGLRTVTRARFAPRPLPGEDVASFVVARLHSLLPVYRAVVTLRAPAGLVAARARRSPRSRTWPSMTRWGGYATRSGQPVVGSRHASRT
ncbi:hypothetical protein GCM10010486_85090 [Nonomuraea roseoviolacea subsp. carminata]|uniref:DNA-binding transcriptional regulator YafY n=1 Tax=Nonomuraea roseoviolacea subsp. carminata TaxID=160689 RepID=A0ABT1K6C2_9ACTN|nr:putative DNA-binding transcriptional regulator YafY [Nonomuraea roseoviolacea subsp. carminata]